MMPAPDNELVNEARSAEALLAEVPSRRVRENVLRAARQAIQPAGGTGTVPHRRWPMALAASVLVGTFGLILTAQLTRKVEPVQVAMASREVSPPAAPAASGAAPAIAPAEAPPLPAKAEAPSRVASSTATPVAKTRALVQPQPEITNLAAASGPQEPQFVAGANAQVASPVPFPAPASSQSSPPQLATDTSADRVEEKRKAGAPETAALAQSAPAARARVADAAAAPAPVLSAQQWIDRIVALRRDGHQDDADRELAELRKRYPTLEIPRAATRQLP
jgi:hypothetical protein